MLQFKFLLPQKTRKKWEKVLFTISMVICDKKTWKEYMLSILNIIYSVRSSNKWSGKIRYWEWEVEIK